MTTTAYLVRHGAHGQLGHVLSGRTSGLGLTEAGRSEAGRAARRLCAGPVAAVYTSPVQRTRETAAIIADAVGVHATVAEELIEIDFGAWTGWSFDRLAGEPGWRWWNEARSQHRPPDGETMLQVQARMASWLAATLQAYPGGAVVAVTHADVIKATLAHALGLSIDHHHRFAVDPGSISAIALDEWGVSVRSMNEVP